MTKKRFERFMTIMDIMFVLCGGFIGFMICYFMMAFGVIG